MRFSFLNFTNFSLYIKQILIASSNRRLKSAFEYWKVWYVKKTKILGTEFYA